MDKGKNIMGVVTKEVINDIVNELKDFRRRMVAIRKGIDTLLDMEYISHADDGLRYVLRMIRCIADGGNEYEY